MHLINRFIHSALIITVFLTCQLWPKTGTTMVVDMTAMATNAVGTTMMQTRITGIVTAIEIRIH